jgi:hypothetical protein
MDEEDQNYLMDRLAAALIADDYSRAKKASVAAAVRSCLLVPQQSCSACSLCLLGPKGTGSGSCSSRPL